MQPTLSTDLVPPHAHLVARGELDVYSVREVSRAVQLALEAGCRDVTLDLSAVTFADAAALGALLRCSRLVQDSLGSLRVTSAGPAVRRVCTMTGLGHRFGLADAAAV